MSIKPVGALQELSLGPTGIYSNDDAPMYQRPASTMTPQEPFAHFAGGAIGIAYKRYLGTYRKDDTDESTQQFADVMTEGGTETFIGKSRGGIVRILGERKSPIPHSTGSVSPSPSKVTEPKYA